ncbi:hypothetical protein JCM5350_001927 [Sporobolomyces pararoseus]
MSINILPVETLEQIFSSNLKQVDLARLCQVSNLFLDIVRPLLYGSVTLQSIRQANQFKNSREEDARLVREIHIVGKGNLWKTKKLSRLEDIFERMDMSERSETEAGVVKRLLEGEIVHPRQIEFIRIYRVAEDPTVLGSPGFSIKPKIFSNLTNLSIMSHRGGLKICSAFLRPAVLPNLQRLLLFEATRCVRPTRKPTPATQQPVRETGIPTASLVLGWRLKKSDLLKIPSLHLLVSPGFTVSDNQRHPSLVHLAAHTSELGIGRQSRYMTLIAPPGSTSNSAVQRAFADLRDLSKNFSDYALRYLVLPSHLSRSELPPSMQETLDILTNLGVSIHFDGDLGSAIGPPSFFEFRKKEEEDEEDKQKKGQGLSGE